jgi:hypothetical protein
MFHNNEYILAVAFHSHIKIFNLCTFAYNSSSLNKSERVHDKSKGEVSFSKFSAFTTNSTSDRAEL